GDAPGGGGVGVAAGGAQDVEVLADVQLDAQLVPDVEHLAGRVPHHQVGVDVGEVADQDGDALAEAALLAPPLLGGVPVGEGQVRRPGAAACRRAVHDVVVEQGERLEELEGGAGVDHRRVVGR